jgi:hypothetical protein
MSRNRKDFKTFYRFDGNGRIIPGSNILKKGYKPEEGTWQQADAYECCNPLGTLYWVTDRYAEIVTENYIESTVQSVIDSEGNTYRVSYFGFPEPEGEVFNFAAIILKQDASGNKLWEVFVSSLGGAFLPLNDIGLKILETGNLAVAAICETAEDGFRLDSFILSPEDGSVLSTAPAGITPNLPGGAGAIEKMYLRGITQGDSPETFRIQLAIEAVSGDQYTHAMSFNLEDPFITRTLTTSFVNSVFDEQYWYGAQGKILSYGADDVYYFAVSGHTLDDNYGSVMTYIRATGASFPAIINSYYVDTSADSSDGEVLYASTYFDDQSGNGWINAIHYDSKVTKWAENQGDGVNWRVGFNIDGETSSTPLGIANDSSGNVFAVILYDLGPVTGLVLIKLSSDGVLDWAVQLSNIEQSFEQTELRNGITISGEQLSIVSQSLPSGSAFKLGTLIKPEPGTYGNYVVSNVNVTVETQPNPTLVNVIPNTTSISANGAGPISMEVFEDEVLGFTVTNLQ